MSRSSKLQGYQLGPARLPVNNNQPEFVNFPFAHTFQLTRHRFGLSLENMEMINEKLSQIDVSPFTSSFRPPINAIQCSQISDVESSAKD